MPYCKSINHLIENISDDLRNNEIVQEAARIIDIETNKNYRLWPTNYLAYDLLENTKRFEKLYDKEAEQNLENRCQMVFEVIDDDKTKLRELFYRMYANPVYTKIKGGFL